MGRVGKRNDLLDTLKAVFVVGVVLPIAVSLTPMANCLGVSGPIIPFIPKKT